MHSYFHIEIHALTGSCNFIDMQVFCVQMVLVRNINL